MIFTIEQLMIPRFIVVKLYPNSPFIIGDIVENWEVTGWQFSSFPEIFQPLHWYKYRKEEELPEYVKFIWEKGEIQQIVKVAEWIKYDTKEADVDPVVVGFIYFHNGQSCRMALNDAVKFTTETGWFPATEEEHEEFHKNKSK